jgi:hypothetical protein
MKLYVRTKTGSVYKLDREEMTWARLSRTEKSGPVRDGEKGGKLLAWPDIEAGRGLLMFVEGHETTPSGLGRYIYTSDVEEVVTACRCGRDHSGPGRVAPFRKCEGDCGLNMLFHAGYHTPLYSSLPLMSWCRECYARERTKVLGLSFLNDIAKFHEEYKGEFVS